MTEEESQSLDPQGNTVSTLLHDAMVCPGIISSMLSSDLGSSPDGVHAMPEAPACRCSTSLC